VELAKFDHMSQEESRFLKQSYYLNITISAFFSSKSGDFVHYFEFLRISDEFIFLGVKWQKFVTWTERKTKNKHCSQTLAQVLITNT
jgi:hypothetical protein